MAAEVISLEQAAGAAAFDALFAQIGQVSKASFDEADHEDWATMVAMLDQALQDVMRRSPGYRAGFLLPLVDAVDCQRLGVVNGDGWSASRALLKAVQRGTKFPA